LRRGDGLPKPCGRLPLLSGGWVEVAQATQAINVRIGIDLDTKTLARLSNGEKIDMPAFVRASEARLATLQRARKSQIHAKIRNRRKDFLHKETTKLVRQYGFIAVGNVSPSKLARTNMTKSVRNAGWPDLRTMPTWKLRIRGGGMCLEVPEHLTTKTCSACGCLPPSRPSPANKEIGLATIAVRFMIVT
jgi:putative transposase